MVAILRSVGVAVTVGRYSIRVDDCDHFVFQEYGGGLGDPSLDVDADTLDEMLRDAGLISAALAAADIQDRFEIYDDSDEMVGYIHHKWPHEPAA